MAEIGTYITQGLIDGINSLLENVYAVWASVREKTEEIWESIKEKLAETWTNLDKTAREKWESMKQAAQENFEKIKEKAGLLKEKFDDLREKTKSAFSNMKETIEGAADSMKGKLDGFISKVKDAIEAVKDFLKSGWEKVRSGFDSGSSGQSYTAMPRAVSLARSIQTPSVPYIHSAIEKLSHVDIPGYATGQVIPTTMKRHLAWLGDNPRETEVVSPLSTIKQAQKESLLEVLSELGLTGGRMGNDRPIIAKLYLDGHQVTEAVIKDGMVRQMSTGNNPFSLGTT